MSELHLWRNKAHAEVTCDPSTPTNNVAQNLLITRAYADLYCRNSRVFKWAGMAAYASDMVGLGIATGKAVDVFVDQ